jgi:hypothetical protein
MAILAVAGLAALTQCKSPFDLANDAAATGQPFTIKATVGGSSFSGGGSCAVQPSPDGEMMTVTASQVVGTSPQTITINLVRPVGTTAPFTAVLGDDQNVATFTDGANTANTYTTENHPNSGTVSITYWDANASGNGYALGTFSFTAYQSTGGTKSVTGGSIKKN